jgi:hypothetical protein
MNAQAVGGGEALQRPLLDDALKIVMRGLGQRARPPRDEGRLGYALR